MNFIPEQFKPLPIIIPSVFTKYHSLCDPNSQIYYCLYCNIFYCSSCYLNCIKIDDTNKLINC